MSVFLKVEKFGASPKLLRLRSLCTSVGEEHRGILTCHAPAVLFFTLWYRNEELRLRACCDHLVCEGQELKRGDEVSIKLGAQAVLWDYTFTFFPVPTDCECLSACRASLASLDAAARSAPRAYPFLTYHLAGIRKRYPLRPNFQLVIGSSTDAAVYIDLPKVRPHHCRICYKDGAVHIVPADGGVATNGCEVSEKTILLSNAQLTLIPAQIELALEFPIVES